MSGDKIKRVRAVRKWLEKAESSYSSNKEITGEINLIMAQAEMQRLHETRKESSAKRWGLRIAAMFAAFGIFLGINAFWNLLHSSVEPQPKPVQIVINEVSSSESSGFASEADKTEVVLKEKTDENTGSGEAGSEVKSAPVFNEPVNMQAEQPSAVPSYHAAAPALSDKEIQSVVGEAGRALRGQA